MTEQINLNAITQVTETDMGKAWEVFDQMRNAVIEGSKLSVQFQELQYQVQQLRQQVEGQIENNKRLDDMYMTQRRYREEAEHQRDKANADLAVTKGDLATAEAKVHNLSADLEAAQQEIRSLRKERDDAQLSAMEWEEKAEGFRKRLDAVTAALGLPSPVQSQPQVPQSQEDQSSPLAQAMSGGGGSSGASVSTTETEEQREERKRREQPRDPVTQQWRSPYEENKPKEDEEWTVPPAPTSSPF